MVDNAEMEYLVTSEDGLDGYLEHHGVKGMKWGVRNADTLRKYGARSTIKKGEQFARITSGDSLKRKDILSKPLYVSTNKKDFDEYKNVAYRLPSVADSKTYREKGKAAVLRLTAKKDLSVATGEDIEKYMLDKYGNTKMSYLQNHSYADAATYQVLTDAVKKEGNPTVRKYYEANKHEPLPYSPITKGEAAVQQLFSTKVGSFEGPISGSRNNKKAMVDYFKKKGYDAMLDYEDAKSLKINVDEPLLILDPSKSVKVTKKKRVTV